MLNHFDMAGVADERRSEARVTTVGGDGLDLGPAVKIHSTENDSSIGQSRQKGQCDRTTGPIAATAHMRHVLYRLLESNMLHA